MPAHERITFDHDDFGTIVQREPAPVLDVFRGTGPDRGAWEEAHPHANDNGAVAAEYEPPRRARWS